MVKTSKRKVCRFSIGFGLCAILTIACGALSRANDFMSQDSCRVKLGIAAKLEWNNPIQLEISEYQRPETGGFLDLPGPKRLPLRPEIRPFASPGGLAALAVQGNGEVMPAAVLIRKTPTLIELPEPPRALRARQDGGIWILNRNALVHRDATGAEVKTFPLAGINLVSGMEDSVWVEGSDNAWFVTADGRVLGPHAWKLGSGNSSASLENSLCTLEKKKPREVRCLDPDGRSRFFALSSPPGPFERLLAFRDDRAIQAVTVSGPDLRFYGTESIAEIRVQSAGLTSPEEKPFISGRQGNEVILCTGPGMQQRLPVPSSIAEAPFFTEFALTVVAVENGRNLVYGIGQANWYDSEEIESTFTVNEQRYRNDVFPYSWYRGSLDFVAINADGTAIISATGPTGLALISVQVSFE